MFYVIKNTSRINVLIYSKKAVPMRNNKYTLIKH